MRDRRFVQISSRPLCALGLLLAGSLTACEQPAPKCNVAHGAFWAQYKLVSGDGECAMLSGEELDVQSYYAPRSSDDERPDYDKASIAIQPFSITAAIGNAAGIAEPAADDVAYAIGRFVTTEPQSDGFCVAPMLATAQLHLPDVAAHDVDMCTTAPAAPAIDVSYEFSNVRVYFTPAAIGTQFTADLTYTQAGCIAKYTVAAVYPMLSCGRATTDPTSVDDDAGVLDAAASDIDASSIVAEVDAATPADAGEPCPAPEPPAGPPVADDSLCEGGGINPDFAVKCDPAAMMCVLAKNAPSLK
jgi:hypothetical protein